MTPYLRAARTLSITTPMLNHHSTSVLVDDEDEAEAPDIDLFLSKEIYDAAEDLSFIANQMRSACQYEEVVPRETRDRLFALLYSRSATIGSTLPQ